MNVENEYSFLPLEASDESKLEVPEIEQSQEETSAENIILVPFFTGLSQSLIKKVVNTTKVSTNSAANTARP